MKQDHIFFDIETSSLDYDSAEVLDMAAIRTDRTGDILAAYSDRIRPSREVDPKSAKVNGYNSSDWANAQEFKAAVAAMAGVILNPKFDTKYVVVAHFSEFDKTILTNQCKAHGIEMPFKRAWLDTAQIAWPYAFNDMLSGRSLDTLCKYFGVVNKSPHTAAGDAAATMHAYWAMMRRLTPALMAEEFLVRKGGQKLDSIRKLVGL